MLKFETFDIDNEVHKNYALNFQSVLYIDNDDGTVRTSFINSTYIGDGKSKYHLGSDYEWENDLIMNKIAIMPYEVV